MLTINDLKIGTRVRCLFYNDNRIGTITKLHDHNGWFYVKFDNITYHSSEVPWSMLSSFELLHQIKEKHCHHCNKLNDTDVSVCWNCAVLDP